MKRVLSLLLACAMIFGMTLVPVSAEGEDFSIEFVSVQKYSETTHAIVNVPVTSANAGDIIAVTFGIKNNTAANVMVGSYQFVIDYDANVLAPYLKDETDEDWDGEYYENGYKALSNLGFTYGATVPGQISAVGVTDTGVAAKKNTITNLGIFLMKVLADAESASIAFSVDPVETAKITDKEENVKTVSRSATTGVTVTGVNPTLNAVAVTTSEFTVHGGDSAAQTTKATATSAKGTNLTTSVAWSVSPADKGVTVAADGTVSVGAKAEARTYTVTATPNGTSILGTAKTASVTVTRDPAAVTTVTVDAKTIAIPTAAVGSATVDLTGKVYDQFGDEMTGKTIIWTLENVGTTGAEIDSSTKAKVTCSGAAGEATIKGTVDGKSGTATLTVTKAGSAVTTVTVDDKTIAIPTAAVGSATVDLTGKVYDQFGDEMTGKTIVWTLENVGTTGAVIDGTSAKVTNTGAAGEATIKGTVDGKSGTATLTVTKAEPVVTTVTVDDKTIAIPTKADGSATVDLTGKVYDQFGDEMTGKTIVWTLENVGTTGAEIDSSTKAKVTYSGAAGEATIKGTVDGKSGTATLTVTKDTPAATEITVAGEGALNIPAAGSTESKTYTVTVIDQFGAEMSGQTVMWTVAPNTGASIDSTGKLTLTDEAVEATYTVTAAIGGVTGTKDVTVTGLPTQNVTFDGNAVSKTYGDEAFTKTAANGTVGGGAITYASSNEDVATVAASTGEVTIVGAGEATITATAARVEGAYAATSASYTLTVAKKTLTASDIEFTSSGYSKTYDGTTDTTAAVQFKSASLVGSDKLTVPGSAAYDSADVASASKIVFTTTELDNADYALAADLTVETAATITALTVTPVIGDIADQTYTAAQIKPAVTVKATVLSAEKTLVEGTDYTVSYGTNKDAGTEAGTVTVTAKSGSNYTFDEAGKKFDISPAAVSVDWSKAETYTYTGLPQTAPTASFTGLGTDGTINCTVTEGGSKTFKNAGTYSFTATTTNTNYTLTGAAVTVEIAKTILEPIIGTVTSKTYNGTTEATGTITFIGALGSDHPTGTATFTWTSAAVGTYTVNVTNIKLDDAFTTNYEVADDKLYDMNAGTTITKADAPKLEVSGEQFLLSNEVTTESKGYFFKLGTLISGIPEDAGNIVYSISSSGTYAAGTIVPTDNLFIQVDSPAAAETGDSVFVIVQSENYKDASVEVVFVFKSKKIVDDYLTVNDITVTYGESYTPVYTYIGTTDSTSEWTYTYEGTGSTVYAASETPPTAVGTYKITAAYSDSIEDGGIPGHIGTTTATLTITPKQLTITDGTLAITKPYDGKTDKGALSGELGLEGVEGAEDVSIDTASQTYAAYSASDAGTYTVKISGLKLKGADMANYTLPETYDFTSAKIEKIDPATSDLSYDLTGANYDGTEKTVSVAAKSTVTGLGAINVKYDGAVSAPSEAGSYTVTADIAAGTNYNAKVLTLGSFTITDNRTASITFQHADGSTGSVTYTKENVTADFPLDVKSGYQYQGWVIKSKGNPVPGFTDTLKAMSSDLLTAIDEFGGTKTLTAEPQFLSLGGIKYFAINTKTAANGTVKAFMIKSPAKITVSFTATPNAGYETASVKVVDEDGNEIDVTDKGNGAYSFVMPYSAVTVSARFVKEGEAPVNFTDVVVSDYFYKAVEWAVENGITEGTSATTFAPAALTTRAEIVTFLWRLFGEPYVNYAMRFTDVPADQWYTEAIRWAASEKYVEGFEDGTFKPGDKVTREQLAAILYRIAEKKGMGFVGASMFLMPFTDLADIHEYAFNGVRWCYMKKIVEGKGNNIMDPRGNAKRSEAITMIYRFNEIISK